MKKTPYLMLLFLLSFLMANEEENYGWNLPNTSLNIGGYLDITYNKEREPKLLFDDIATIFSGSLNRFSLLGEIELSKISLDGKSNGSNDVDVNIERLQLSYVLSDEQNIQIGRFNSDIGFWNQAPILILQDTTSLPHMIGNLFPKATTGVLFRQNITPEQTLSFSFQDNPDLNHQENEPQIEEHTALSYYGNHNDLSWFIAMGRYSVDKEKSATYVGLGSEYEGEEFTIQAEFFTQKELQKSKNPYSGYLQSTWHTRENEDAVIRLETYQDTNLDIREEIYLLGYVYRPWSNLALKGEYLYHTKLPSNCFVYSLSVLF